MTTAYAQDPVNYRQGYRNQGQTQLSSNENSQSPSNTITEDIHKAQKKLSDLDLFGSTSKQQLQQLKQEYLKLKKREWLYWFAAGAGVFLLGLIVGLLLPRIVDRQRRIKWY